VRATTSKTADVAGDGTTTATVLAHAMIREGHKAIAAGLNPMDLKRGIDLTVRTAVEELGKQAIPCADSKSIAQVATVSANWNEDIGEILARAMDRVGRDGVITVEEGKSLNNELEIVEGMQSFCRCVSAPFVSEPDNLRHGIAPIMSDFSPDRLELTCPISLPSCAIPARLRWLTPPSGSASAATRTP
jgi:chaperonin GroEL